MTLDLNFQTAIIDLFVLLTLFGAFKYLRRLLNNSTFRWLSWALPITATINGIAWTYWPALSSHRLDQPPFGQAIAILSLIAMLLLPLVSKRFRTDLSQADFQPLAAFSYWRVIYGAWLIILGLQSALPMAFFWSAGLGDIAAGVIAIVLAVLKTKDSSKLFFIWNVFALADLIHVLTLGAIFLRPFFLGHPEIPPLNFLPLAGVPMLVALHIFALIGLFAKRKAVA